MSTLQAADYIQFVPIATLSPWEGNPRGITTERMEALKRSLLEDPEILLARPLIARPDGTVIAGNQRLEAMRQLLRAADGPFADWVRERKGIPVFVTEMDDKLMIERAVRDNQPYGEWERDLLAGILVGYEDEFGDSDLLGVDPDEAENLRILVEAARSEEEALVSGPEPATPDLQPRRRAEAFAVTVTFEDKADRDRFAAELRDAGHERVTSHVGRWESD